MKKITALLLISAIIFSPALIYAQINNEEAGELTAEEIVEKKSGSSDKENIELHKIIISADRIEKEKKEVWLPSSVVDSKEINEKMYTSMADLLESTPGFSRVYDYHSPFILRGTSGTKMLILRNGNPRFSSFPGGFMGQNVNIYDVERVEVIRGPGSVIYGSGATCGIINIIDRDIFTEKKAGFEAGGSFGSNGNSRMTVGNAFMNNDSFAFRVTGRYRKSDNYYYGGGDEALNSFHEDKDISLNTGYKFNEHHKVILRGAVHYGGPWGKAYGFNDKEQMLARNESDNLLDFSGRYEGDKIAVFDKILVSAYYNRETRDYHNMKMNSSLARINFEDVTDFKNISWGGHTLASVQAGINYLNFGIDSYTVKLWNPVKTVDHYNYAEPTVTHEKTQSQGAGTSSIGLYLQDNMKLSERVSVIGGVRYDYAEIFEGDNYDGEEEIEKKRNAVSANAGFIFNPHKIHTFTLNLGRAFRMPDAVDMFSEQVTCQGTIVPNPELKPEYSWNIDAGYMGNYHGIVWEISLFMNQYHDLIVKVDNPDDSSEQMMSNEAYARILGGELVISWRNRDVFIQGLSIKPGLSASYCIGDSFASEEDQWDLTSSGDPITGIPPVNIKPYIRFMYAGKSCRSYYFEVEGDNSLKKTRLSDTESEAAWSNEDVNAYMIINLTAGVSLFDCLYLEEIKFNIAVNNLMDEKYYPFGSHIPGKGRDIKIFLSFKY
ncbi:MAG: TonB-dependent receptor [Spirochaetes bacterium]|nr:TonB-dependent receptor [Spirochaetota bacterium]